MTERDWQRDWAWANDIYVCLSDRVRGMLVYWLQRVREWEAQAAALRKVLEDGRSIFWRVAEVYCETLDQFEQGKRTGTLNVPELIDNFKRSIREAVGDWTDQANQALSADAGRALLRQIRELEQENARLYQQVQELETQVAAMREILKEIAAVEPAWEDDRLEWVEIQVYKDTLDKARRLLNS